MRFLQTREMNFYREMSVCRVMARCMAGCDYRVGRSFASGRTARGEDDKEDEEKGRGDGADEGSGRWGSKDIHLEGSLNAYEILGVSPSCSPQRLRDVFTKLAKLTHPDLHPGQSSSARFILVLSAYQILSCPVKRAQYDASLRERSQAQKGAWNVEVKRSPDHVSKDSEVVEWLRWYRKMTMNMIHEREIGAEGGFYDAFRVNLQEAMQRAYFGPQIEDDIWALPDCFEAEERTEASDMELLHLVSGQKLIGLVLQVEPKGLLEESTLKLDSLAHSQLSQNPVSSLGKRFHSLHSNELHGIHGLRENQMGVQRNHDQSTFVELELYLHGNLVARATRAESKLTGNPRVSGAKFLDEITVYLCVDRHTKQHSENVSGKFNEVLLGSIRGLNMTESGDKGIVYSPSGVQTHIIWQFRTPYVKHVHWFKVDGKRMLCECKSTRARLPSSKYWLFEPRCDKHDVGGWYFETLWRRGQVGLRETETTTYWAGKELGLLHPAMYIFGTAYKTLDMEAIKRRERPVWSVIWNRHIRLTGMILKAIQWCQTKVLALKH